MVSITLNLFGGSKPPAISSTRRSTRRTYSSYIPSSSNSHESPLGDSNCDNESDSTESSNTKQNISINPLVMKTVGIAASEKSWPLFLRAFTLNASHIAYQMLSRPLQPLINNRIKARIAASDSIHRACQALHVNDLAGLQDLCNSLVVAESVYRIVDTTEEDAVKLITALKNTFPFGLVTLQAAQFAKEHVRHRFVIAESTDALYVGFMGTKLPRDYLANAAVFQEEVALDENEISFSKNEPIAISNSPNTSTNRQQQQAPAAHRGFVTRSKSIPIDALWSEAQRKGKRLVLCGHSLGAAVAQLCTIHLLQRLPQEHHSSIFCFGFATPALGNEALSTLVKERKYNERMLTYLVPEDPIPHLLALPSSALGSTTSTTTSTSTSTNGDNNNGTTSMKEEEVSLNGNAFSIVQAASNITAFPGKLLTRFGQTKEESGRREEYALSMKETHADIPRPSSIATPGSRSFTLSAVLDKATKVPSVSVRAVTETAMTAVNFAAAVPLKAAQRYFPLGQQLYILPDAVKTEKPDVNSIDSIYRGGSVDHSTITMNNGTSIITTNGNSTTNATTTTTTSHNIKNEKKKKQSWLFQWATPPTALPSSSFSHEDDNSGVDDDNIDVVAAASHIVSIPHQLPARTMFPMHRMLTYRSRLLHICQTMLNSDPNSNNNNHIGSTNSTAHDNASNNHHTLAADNNNNNNNNKLVSLSFLIPSLSSLAGTDVVATELLAPRIFPLRAIAHMPHHTTGVSSSMSSMSSDIESFTHPLGDGTYNNNNNNNGEEEEAKKRSVEGSPSLISSSWNGATILNKITGIGALLHSRSFYSAQSNKHSSKNKNNALVDVVIRIEGKGLNNVTRAWVTAGGWKDRKTGHDVPAVVDILHKPSSTLVSGHNTIKSSTSSNTNLAAPISSFMSWVAISAGWLSVVRKLQPTTSSDFVLARVQLPGDVVAQHMAQHFDPLLMAVSGGNNERLMVHLQSDFAEYAIPLEINESSDAVVDTPSSSLSSSSSSLFSSITALAISRGASMKRNNNNGPMMMSGGYKDVSVFLRSARVDVFNKRGRRSATR